MRTRSLTEGEPELEVTYRRGKPLAAYYHLPQRSTQQSFKTRRVEPGLVIDFSRSGKPLGIEILVPTHFSLVDLNRALRQVGAPLARRADLAPILRA